MSEPDLLTVLTQLYEAELNCRIASFWDGGFTVELGDEQNGVVAKETFYPGDERFGRPMAGMADWLLATAREHYPAAFAA